MSDQQPAATPPPDRRGMTEFWRNVRVLSPWKRKLMGLFLIFAGVGGVMWTHATLTRPAPTAAVYLSDDSHGGIGLLGERDARVEADEPGELAWHGRLGGWMARLGVSFAVGLVIGVFFRTFLKTMAAVTAVAASGFVALSYFEVFDFDFTTMRANYDTAAGWLRGQGQALKDLFVAYLPSATASTIGFVTGFLRR